MDAKGVKPDDNEVTRFLSAWFAVRQIIQAANFNHFHQAGLSATQFMTLNLLPDNEGSIAIGELARRMNLKPATVAKIVDSLEQRQMLRRVKSPEDRWLVLVRITERGKKLQNTAVGQFREHISAMFRTIPAENRTALIRGLESLVRVASEEAKRTGTVLTHGVSAAAPVQRSSRRFRQ